FVFRQVVAQQDFRIAAILADILEKAAPVAGAQLNEFADFVQHGIDVALNSSRHDRQGVVPMIAGQDNAIPVDDLAAPRGNGYHGDPVLLGPGRQAVMADHLQMPQTYPQQTEAQQRKKAGHPDAHQHALALDLRSLLEFEHAWRRPQTAPPSPSSWRRCGICNSTSTNGHNSAMRKADHSQFHPSHSPASQPSMRRLADLAMTKMGSTCRH